MVGTGARLFKGLIECLSEGIGDGHSLASRRRSEMGTVVDGC